MVGIHAARIVARPARRIEIVLWVIVTLIRIRRMIRIGRRPVGIGVVLILVLRMRLRWRRMRLRLWRAVIVLLLRPDVSGVQRKTGQCQNADFVLS